VGNKCAIFSTMLMQKPSAQNKGCAPGLPCLIRSQLLQAVCGPNPRVRSAAYKMIVTLVT